MNKTGEWLNYIWNETIPWERSSLTGLIPDPSMEMEDRLAEAISKMFIPLMTSPVRITTHKITTTIIVFKKIKIVINILNVSQRLLLWLPYD